MRVVRKRKLILILPFLSPCSLRVCAVGGANFFALMIVQIKCPIVQMKKQAGYCFLGR